MGVVGLTALFLGIFTPITMARIFEGSDGNISLYFYKENYQKHKDINNLYLVVDKSIKFNNNSGIAEYYPKLNKEDRYDELIDFLNEENAKTDNMLQKVMMSNEDNRLKTRYVTAIAELGMRSEAFTFAVNDLNNANSANNFALAPLAKYVGASTLGDATYNAVYALLDSFELRYNTAASANDKFESAKMSRKALEVSEFLITVYDHINVPGFATLDDIKAKRDSFSAIFVLLIA